MGWYDRKSDKTVYQLGLTTQELSNLAAIISHALINNVGYIGCATEGNAFREARTAAADLNERIKRLANAADDAGRARMVIETEARGVE